MHLLIVLCIPITKVGHGLELAQAAAQQLSPADQEALASPAQVPHVGSIPPDFGSITGYENPDILSMIIFYNDDFGNLPDDS
jgi:hypothetical protein